MKNERVYKVIGEIPTPETAPETFTLRRDYEPDVELTGWNVSDVSSFDGSPGQRNARWTELSLFLTKGGKFVCQEVGRTRKPDESDRNRVHVAQTLTELSQAVGFGWLAKKLYAEAGIDVAEVID